MTGRTTRAARAVGIAAAALVWVGCVNNYVVDASDSGALTEDDGPGDGLAETADPEPEDGSSSDDGGTTGSGGASGDGTTAMDGATGDMPTTGMGDGDGGSGDRGDGSGGGDSGGGGVCSSCAGDTSCGDGRGCVDLGGDGPVCLDACTEMRPPCAGAATCQSLTTVDRAPRMLCVPTNTCMGG